MAMKKCKECDKDISSKAKTCPYCGAPNKKKFGIFTYVIVGFFALVFFSMIGSLMQDSPSSSSKPDAGFKIPGFGKQVVSFDKYKQIQNGMSYRKVVSIIGSEGEESSRNKIDGVPGVMSSVETVMYQWVNGNGSNMNAMFQNDKLIQKAQFGLK